MEKLQRRLEEGKANEGSLPPDNNRGGIGLARVNNHQQMRDSNTIEFDELMNTSIDAITRRI